MKINTLFTLALVFFFSHTVMATNSPIHVGKAKPSFDSIQTLFQKLQGYQKIVITADFDSLVADRRTDVEQLAKVEVTGKGQPNLALNIKLRLRGKFRRLKCDIPPMRLNFDKVELKGLSLYQKYDKLKLVTHCSADATDAQALLKEYWTYKLYNEVTENSFRVHLLEVTYVDKKDPANKIESYAFIIENSKEMAHRLNGEVIERFGVKQTDLISAPYHDALLFNYMIGNTDWAYATPKNLKLVKHKDHAFYTIVPYDFDFAKIVDGPLLRISTTIPNLDKNNRAAKDSFKDKAALESSIAKFQALKETGFTCFKNCEILPKKEKNAMALYLKSFFKLTKNKQKLTSVFLTAP